MPAPSNDNLADATAIIGPNWSVNTTTFQASAEPGEIAYTQTVWFSYDPATTGVAQFNISQTTADTYLRVYVGPANPTFADLALVAQDDDSGSAPNGVGSAVSFQAVAGQHYYIQLDGFYQGNSTIQQTFGPEGLPPAPCFCAGTMIRTLRGETAVEALVPGDVLVLASGAVDVVRFVGVSTERMVGGRYKTDRLPVIIRQGALGENQPNRDLHLAPGHAIAHGDLLVPARRLVNGTTIVVDAAPVDLKYYHVRLDRHEVLVSNGVASESFKHDPKWAAFDNADQYAERFPLDAAMSEAECRLAHREAGRRVTAKYPAPRDLLATIAQRAEVLGVSAEAVQAA